VYYARHLDSDWMARASHVPFINPKKKKPQTNNSSRCLSFSLKFLENVQTWSQLVGELHNPGMARGHPNEAMLLAWWFGEMEVANIRIFYWCGRLRFWWGLG
jgi:hypothetical protein